MIHLSKNAIKPLLIAADIIIVCVLIGFAIFGVRSYSKLARASMDKNNQLNETLQKADLSTLDGMIVTGIEARALTRKYFDENLIIVCDPSEGNTITFNKRDGNTSGKESIDSTFAEGAKYQISLVKGIASDSVFKIEFTELVIENDADSSYLDNEGSSLRELLKGWYYALFGGNPVDTTFVSLSDSISSKVNVSTMDSVRRWKDFVASIPDEYKEGRWSEETGWFASNGSDNGWGNAMDALEEYVEDLKRGQTPSQEPSAAPSAVPSVAPSQEPSVAPISTFSPFVITPLSGNGYSVSLNGFTSNGYLCYVIDDGNGDCMVFKSGKCLKATGKYSSESVYGQYSVGSSSTGLFKFNVPEDDKEVHNGFILYKNPVVGSLNYSVNAGDGLVSVELSSDTFSASVGDLSRVALQDVLGVNGKLSGLQISQGMSFLNYTRSGSQLLYSSSNGVGGNLPSSLSVTGSDYSSLFGDDGLFPNGGTMRFDYSLLRE